MPPPKTKNNLEINRRNHKGIEKVQTLISGIDTPKGITLSAQSLKRRLPNHPPKQRINTNIQTILNIHKVIYITII